MTTSKLGAFFAMAVGVAAGCSSSTLSTKPHDSGIPTPKDSGRDAPADVANPAPVDSGPSPNVDSGRQVDACAPPVTPSEVPTQHRAVATACPASIYVFGSDPSQISCTTNLDCAGDAGTSSLVCLHGHCSRDQCLTDADCAANEACACARSTASWNVCVATGCHVDSDCGATGYCSPSWGPCGSAEGYHCHTPNDSCVDATKDCQCGTGIPNCTYTPTAGTFVCSHQTCAG